MTMTPEVKVPDFPAIEWDGDNTSMHLDALEEIAGDIAELVDTLNGEKELSVDEQQLADALRELDVDLHRHTKKIREIMATLFVVK